MIVTRSDGSEYVRLVGVDLSQIHHIDRVLDEVLDQLTDIAGSRNRAQKALLAVLGERLLPERAENDDEARIDFTRKRAQYG